MELEMEMMKELTNDQLRHMGMLNSAAQDSHQQAFKFKFYSQLKILNDKGKSSSSGVEVDIDKTPF